MGRTEEPGRPSGEKWVAYDWLQLMWCVEFMLFGFAESAYLINKIMAGIKYPKNKPIYWMDDSEALKRNYCLVEILFKG